MTLSLETMLCSDADREVGDEQRGSAATFDTFVLIEHQAAFGREAADDAVRATYAAAADDVLALDALRPFAIRSVGRTETTDTRIRFVGRTGERGFLRTSPATPELAELAALATTAIPDDRLAEPLFAVCTNGSRDRCCAIKGRDLAAELHRVLDDPDDDDSVVEISHLGGHRFAPTMLVLPTGYAYGRLDPDTALEIAYAAQDGLVHPKNLRGRADLSPAAQVADAVWRSEIGPAPLTAVDVFAAERHGQFQIVTAFVDGREESLRIRQVAGDVIPATACGGKPIAAIGWEIDGL